MTLYEGVSGLVAREQQTISINDIHHLPPHIPEVKLDDKTNQITPRRPNPLQRELSMERSA